MEKYRPDIVVDVGPELLNYVVEPLRSLLVGEVDPARQLVHQHPSHREVLTEMSSLKVLTNEKRGGLKVVAFDRSPFKLFTLRFSIKSVQAPSCKRPKPRVGIKKPTQKNPPKKTQKNPPKKTH
jgi:hypothetical protein